ncbi:MAG: hypothetical protein HYS14_06890 [Candidatus Rokubacteria bacterium]|nr:hypothetical protein [Candidatus Rokubacteria bacterium]
MSRVVLLTRPSNWQGVLTLRECSRQGLAVSGVILEPKGLGERLRRLWKFLKLNGPADTARKIWHTVLSDRRFRREVKRVYRDDVPSSVRDIGSLLGMPVYEVGSHNDQQCEQLLEELSADFILLAGTCIIKPHILKQARLGCLNAHTGWLPDYRGVHANLWSLLEGGRLGVTVHYVDPGVDTGPILLREELRVVPGDTLETIELRTAELCARMMVDTIKAIENGAAVPCPQRLGEGRCYRALPFRKEQEVRRLLKRMARAGVANGQAS